MRVPLFSVVLVLTACVCFAQSTDRDVAVRAVNYDKSKIAPYTLEDPLTFLDGRRVTKATWSKRRKEILDIFAKEMYGVEPPPPKALVTELVNERVGVVGGLAIRRQYRMWFKRDRSGPAINWIVWIPMKAKKPVPVISFLNYQGNHELVPDTDIPLPDVWLPEQHDGSVENHRPVEKRRGVWQKPGSNAVLPLEKIFAHGYAVMSACYGEVSRDPWPPAPCDTNTYDRVFTLWGKRDMKRPDDVTSLGAWGWALCRGLDLAERIPEIDAKRSVVTGYSRLGKAALIAAARDERFAVCVPNQTGGGGCPLSKRDYGENISTENRMFPHWYCRAYAKYAADPARLLTFDQHLFLACIAPRALLVEGFDDRWFDTEGEYLALKAASPVWKLLTDDGLPEVPWPGDRDTSAIGRNLGYVRRSGSHGLSADDWKWLLDFSDRALGQPRTETVALQGKIDALAAKGGGTLVVRKGVHPTGALFFKPGVNLHLEEGAILQGSDDGADYPLCDTRIEGETCRYYPALINADRCDDFKITGRGTVDGHGFKTWETFWLRLNEARAATGRVDSFRNKDLMRPRVLYVSNSKNVDVSGVTFKNSKFWTTHFYQCENVLVHDCAIIAEITRDSLGRELRGPSTDAVDIDKCRNFTVRNCRISVNDDGVVIKGGKGAWANDYTRHPENGPTSNVLVENCVFLAPTHSCLTLGSECPEARGIVMRNCRMDGVGDMLYLKMRTDTPQHYSDVLVEGMSGDCRTVLHAGAWTQYADFGGRPREELKSFATNVVIRNCRVNCRVVRNVREDPQVFELKGLELDDRAVKSVGTRPPLRVE